jgi:hypothetical protein
LPGDGKLEIGILCRESDRQLSFIEQVCNSLHPLFNVEDLLLPFSAVKNLFVSYKFAPGIAAAMEELDGGRITKVLSRLQDIFVEELEALGSFQENIRRFVAARQLLITLSSFLTGTDTPTWFRIDAARKLQLASPLAYFFISPEKFPIPRPLFSPLSIVHCTPSLTRLHTCTCTHTIKYL